MKELKNHSEELRFVNHASCCQKKCVNCFELGGCIYEQHPVSTIHHMAESKAESQLKDMAQLPKRA